MLDKIILGLLCLKDLTSYDIKKAMDHSINHFYTTSYGSIHPALVKLEKNGWVESRQMNEGGRTKKMYSITTEGREIFTIWLNGDIVPARLKEPAVVKMFFFGMLSAERREELTQNYISSIEEQIEALQRLKDEVTAREIPEPFREIAHFQYETLNYGIDQARFTQEWFENFQSETKGESHE